jgi:ElaB/YqjD/DUF883 family membrane-anchored ribosome-binding protein
VGFGGSRELATLRPIGTGNAQRFTTFGRTIFRNEERLITMVRNNTTQGISSAACEAAEQMQELGGQLRAKAGQAVESVREMGREAGRAAQAKFEGVRDTTADYLEQGRERARELGHSVEHQIQDRPVRAVLIAAGIGFVMGVIFMRR